MKQLILLLLLIFLGLVESDKFIVLVAGSNSFANYRHQADICHAYQLFHENGYPDSNIIVMMYDDIAHDESNPFPGTILNKIGGYNVYVDVPKDYVGDDVTSKNFMAILHGDNSTGKRVLNTGPKDDIFVYFSDHGGAGLIAFPNDELYAYQLIETFEYMYFGNQFRNIVFYLEACESGSMFNGLLDPRLNILGVTASNPMEPSYACYMDAEIGTYLGDDFSVNWMENADNFEILMNETIADEIIKIQAETNTSHVCVYGNYYLTNTNMSYYLRYNSTLRKMNSPKNKFMGTKKFMNSRDVKMEFLMKQYLKSNSIKREKILDELSHELYQHKVLKSMYGAPKTINGVSCYPEEYIDTRCLQNKVEEFKKVHGPLTDTSLKYIRNIGAECFS